VVVVLGGCYGDPLPDLAPRGVSDCPELDSCALATGGELVADAFSTTDVRESALVDSVVVTPDGIVEAIVLPDQRGVMLHAVVAGTAHLHAVLHTGDVSMPFDRDLRVADIATAKITPTVYPVGIGPPPAHLAAFTGASVELAVSYHDANGAPLLGSGIEDWTTSSGMLTAELAHGPEADSSRFRTLQISDATAVVSANNATLTIDSRPAGSTKTLDLGACAWLGKDGAILPVASGDRLDVSPSGPPTFTLDDPSLVALTAVDQSFTVTAKATGSTLMHLSFDGVVSTFQLGVQ